MVFLILGIGSLPGIDAAEQVFGGKIGRSYEESEEWWAVSAAADVGGFGIGSDLMIDTNVHLRRRFSKHTTIGFGYRFTDIDYDRGSFEYDQQLHGPVLGLAFNF